MTVHTRPAAPADAEAMCAVIDPVIEAGGTTAHQSPFDAARMLHHYLAPERLISCVIAEVDGKVVGFQSLEWSDPDWSGDDALPADWGIIASFVMLGCQGNGVGRALFAATRSAATSASVAVIDATIRADNIAGLSYYSGLGFINYGRLVGIPLRDGTIVDRIRKRFDL